jgi:hypothetical protein
MVMKDKVSIPVSVIGWVVGGGLMVGGMVLIGDVSPIQFVGALAISLGSIIFWNLTK